MNQLKSLQDSYQNLKRKFGQTSSEIDFELNKVDELTFNLQKVFDDFIQAYNSFTTREEKLSQLHVQAVKKSQELTKKMNLELLSASSQKGQMLEIIDDLNIKLKKARAQIPNSELLQKTLQENETFKLKFSDLET